VTLRPNANAFDVETEVKPMPAKTEKQRRFMGAELERKR